jgi:hypothetical protein
MAKKPKKRRVTGGVDTHKDTHHVPWWRTHCTMTAYRRTP